MELWVIFIAAAAGYAAYALAKRFLDFADHLNVPSALDDPLMRDLRAELDDHTQVVGRRTPTSIAG